MPRLIALLVCCAALGACVVSRQALAPVPWEQRLAELQQAKSWQLDGRAAVAVGPQGWQASLNWRQQVDTTDVHLSGPLGVGAVVIEQTVAGLSVNGAPPSAAVMAQLQQRLGFELPVDDLRYWLLGVPHAGGPFELTRNDQDRALLLSQSGWTVAYDRYMPVKGDWLPAHLVLSREGVRVRIAVDHWHGPR